MKNKLFLILLAAAFSHPAFSQNKDTVKVGPVTVIQCKDCDNENSGKVTSVKIGSDNKDKKTENVKFSWFGFDIGINSYVDKSAYGTDEVNDFVRLGPNNPEATEDLFSLRTIKSVNVNIWPLLVKVNLIQHAVNLKTGFGIVMNNYRYAKDLIYVNEPDKTYIQLNETPFKKDKLFTEYLTVPVLLNFSSNPDHDSKSFHFSAGPTFGLLVKSRTKQKLPGGKKIKGNYPYNLEKFRTGLRAEIGYGPVNFYGSYSFTPIHKYGLEQYPFAIGLSLNW